MGRKICYPSWGLRYWRWSSITDKTFVWFWWCGTKSVICVFVPNDTQENEDARLAQPLPALVFSLSEIFHHHRGYEKIFEVNTNGDIEDMGLCNFTKDTSVTPAPFELYSSYKPIHQKSIPLHHPVPSKNIAQKKNPNPNS